MMEERKIISRQEAIGMGLTVYFTGEPCKHGHVAERKVINRICRECERASSRSNYAKHKERASAYYAKYHPANRDRRAERDRTRRSNDPAFRLIGDMRSMLHRVLRGRLSTTKSVAALGYGQDELRAHIERQFTTGMTWEKVGREIHIDHIIPITEMVAKGETDPSIINALSNLRPMWSHENQRKGAKRINLI